MTSQIDPRVTRFKNVRLLRNHQIQTEDLWISTGIIIAPQERADREIDVEGLLIAPGYIDLQINGGFGIDFSTQFFDVESVAKQLPKYGVTAFIPTIVSSPQSAYPPILTQFKQIGNGVGSAILGLHLEGPFINPNFPGAHRVDLIQNFSPTSLEDFYGNLEDVKIVTLAPELPGAIEAIQFLRSKGITAAAGHTAATKIEMQKAMEAGLTLVTHLFNAMMPFNHRHPGIIGEALTNSNLFFSLIADGIHLEPTTLQLAWKANPKGLFLVTDAMAGLGLNPGRYSIGNREVIVDQDQAKITDSNVIAGSVLSMDGAVRLFKQSTGCSTIEALETVTIKPAKILGIANRKGTLNLGSDADFIILDNNLHVQATYISGQLVWKTAMKNDFVA